MHGATLVGRGAVGLQLSVGMVRSQDVESVNREYHDSRIGTEGGRTGSDGNTM